MSLDIASRLALRNHPAIVALVLILAITNAAATNRAIDRNLITLDLTRAVGLTRSLNLDRVPTSDRTLTRNLSRALDHVRSDFTDANLSDVDLGGVSLAGVRWSMATTWPSDEWRAQALLNSRDLGGDGTYEIQGGNTKVPAHST
ncbi:hypothetical protein O7632_11375 [Solwaraspora sp. WMMD406]|uniref:hypothetical protein n=1 Tax=Solwaraspora sp. WMMD406 TaxID=3016095 RepID=UPI00241794E8|nr:hypothetical protein [Solwaraspora sp. WMMD406]MDG4764698.1 hypothetical protein [Solwaraspora sp. WMMD406]